MLRGGADGADLGPVPRMHALTGHADELAVYTPAAVASQVDGRPGEGAGLRLLREGEHVGYVRTHERRELGVGIHLRVDDVVNRLSRRTRSSRPSWRCRIQAEPLVEHRGRARAEHPRRVGLPPPPCPTLLP